MKNILIIFFILNTAFCFSQEKEEEVFTIVEEMPEYPGGMAEMTNFIRKNLVFPQSAIKDSTFFECKTYIKFVVDEKGDISMAEIIKSCNGCSDCDKEAIRIIKSMPRWKPGRMSGRPVKTFYTMPLKFKK